VLVGQLAQGGDLAQPGHPPGATERSPGQEHEALLLAGGEEPRAVRLALPGVVLVLHRHDLDVPLRLAELRERHVGQPDVLHEAAFLRLAHGL